MSEGHIEVALMDLNHREHSLKHIQRYINCALGLFSAYQIERKAATPLENKLKEALFWCNDHIDTIKWERKQYMELYGKDFCSEIDLEAYNKPPKKEKENE